MLSIFGSTSAGHAQSYYKQSDYYAEANEGDDKEKDDEGLVDSFGGSLSERLGLGESFDRGTFEQLLQGRINEDTQVGRKGLGGEIEHRPGWDLTFSAPKSVSIMALMEGGDPRLIEAHRQAVSVVMKHVEDNLAFIRRSVGDRQKLVKVEGLSYASFEHGTSRALDPQLHTHNFVFNFGLDKGDFRSLESKPIYDNMVSLGVMYRNELAHLCKKLGHEIEVSKDNLFELADVPKDLISNFSKRRTEILAAAKEFGLEGGRDMQRATLLTRESKIHVSKSDLNSAWNKEAESFGFSSSAITKKAIERTSEGEQKSFDDRSAIEDVRLSVNHLSQFESAFGLKELLEFTRGHSFGRYSHDELNQAVLSLKREGLIFDSNLTSIKGQDHYLVSAKALDTEITMLSDLRNGQGRFSPIYSQSQVDSQIKKVEENSIKNGHDHGFTKGQAAAFSLALTSKDQFIGVNGRAGTGKTFMQKELKQMLEGAGYTVRGLAPTGEAARKLQEDSGIESTTIDSFIYREQQNASVKRGADKQFWVLDEASLANQQHFSDVMSLAKEQGARVLFQGDVDQLGSVEAGRGFELLVQHGMSHVEMKEIMRQKQEAERQAVEASIDRNYQKVFNKLGEFVKTDSSHSELLEDWKKLAPEDREKSLIVIPDVATRDTVSNDIHEFKKEKGEIGEKDIEVPILVNSRFSDAQKSYGRFYQAGMIVEFQRDYPSINVKQGERYVVVRSNKDLENVELAGVGDVSTSVILGKQDLSHLKWSKGGMHWNPNTVAGKAKRGVEVFNMESRRFSVGESFKWTKSDKEVKNGSKGVIGDINHETGDMTLVFQNGVRRTVNVKEAHTMDYNYVHTAFSAQGLGKEFVFMLSEFHRRNLVNQKSFYVKLSRMIERTYLYTNKGKEELAKALSGREGKKESALEHTKGSVSNDRLMSNFMKSFAGSVSERQGQAQNSPPRDQHKNNQQQQQKQQQQQQTLKPERNRGRGDFSR